MSSKFKPGDRVKRIKGIDFPHFNLYKGKEYTVRSCSKHNITLFEVGESFEPSYFELVDDTTFEGNV